jgi:type IV secretion system protein VirB10
MTEEKEQKEENTEEEKSPLVNFLEQFKAMSDQKKKAFIAFILISFAAIIYFIFFSGDKPQKDPVIKKTITTNDMTSREPYPTKVDNSEIIAAMKVKDLTPPAPLAPPAPPPPLEPIKEEASLPVTPPPPQVMEPLQVTPPQLPVPRARKDAKDLASEAKASGISMTNIMTFGSGLGSSLKDDKNQSQDEKKDTSNFLGFDGGLIDNSSLQKTSAKRISATKIDNSLSYTIVQGKVIDAVLETAINTQLQAGVIRAIVSRDIYGEQGDIILIPKGSRLVGSYNSSSSTSGTNKAVLTRVFAGWNRIITPNGMDINLSNTPSSDALGRNGIPGYLDTNLSNNLINAFLVSVLGPYVAAKATGMANEQITNNNNVNPSGGITTSSSSSVGAKVLTDGLDKFQTVAKNQLDKIYPPDVTTIYVDQGTKIDIIVQEDIVFPKDAINHSNNLP